MKILEYTNKHQEEILSDLKDLVNHESPSLDKKLVDESGEFLKRLISERLGINEVTEYPNDNVGSHLRFEYGNGKEQILFLVHYDTVWEKGELKTHTDEGKLYGPGTFDMKGGIIQGIWSLKTLKDLNYTLNKRVAFLFTSDEELLSPTSRELIESEAKKSSVVLVLEPPEAKTNSLKIARKGAATYNIKAHGIASHAGNDPDPNASAIHEIAHQIRYLESLADFDKGTTINVGIFNGGTRSNIICDEATAEVDVRFSTQEEAIRVEQEILKLEPILEKTTVEVSGKINRPPMEYSDESRKLFEKAKESGEEIGINITGASVGGVSDGNFTAAKGVPTLDGLGAVGEGPHARHEHIVIDHLPKRTALLTNLILRL